MPVLVVDDECLLVGLGLAALRDDVVGLFGDALVEFLAVSVILVDGAGTVEGVGAVAGHEQLDSLASALHSSAGVDARPDLEDNVADCYLLTGEAADTYDGAQTEVRIAVETPQTVVGHDTVLVDHRHEVGGDADSHQIEHSSRSAGARALLMANACMNLKPTPHPLRWLHG